jgi:hypothetical protein
VIGDVSKSALQKQVGLDPLLVLKYDGAS